MPAAHPSKNIAGFLYRSLQVTVIVVYKQVTQDLLALTPYQKANSGLELANPLGYMLEQQ